MSLRVIIGINRRKTTRATTRETKQRNNGIKISASTTARSLFVLCPGVQWMWRREQVGAPEDAESSERAGKS